MDAEPLERLRQLASEFGDAYRATPGLAVVAVVGSVADGTADAWSDLDLLLFWDRPHVAPLDPASLGAGVESLVSERSDERNHAVEVWTVDGTRVELTHYTLGLLDEMATAVGHRCEPRTDYQVQMRLLLDSMPVLGGDELATRLAPVAEYPEALAETVVSLNLDFYPWAMYAVLVRRDDVIFARQVLVQTVESTMGVLIGVNRIYGSPTEATSYARFIRRMAVKPADLEARLRALVTVAPGEAAPLRRALIDDVFSIVHDHVPGMDTTTARRVYEIT